MRVPDTFWNEVYDVQGIVRVGYYELLVYHNLSNFAPFS